MKFDYGTVVNALRQEAQTQTQLQPLRNDRCNSLFLCHSKPADQVFLLFHSFTASPDQLREIGSAIFQAGYNVIIPLLPGHGLQGTWNYDSPPPLPLHRRIYEEFAMRWFKRSRILGKSITLGGGGTGATLATDFAVQHPSAIQRLLLLDPYMPATSATPTPLLPYQLVTMPHTNPQPGPQSSHQSSNESSNQKNNQAEESYWEWIIPRQGEPPAGYDGFNLRSLQIWFEIAQEVFKRVQVSPLPPVLVVGSERERALGDETSRLFCEYIRQYQPKTWHIYYNVVLDLTHALFTGRPEVQPQYLACLIEQYAQVALNASAA
jgi:pimeloyl-ACP methyl ester carboxylesterase